jgi:hypothetical protein
MTEQLEANLTGVLCLHCGMPTPLPILIHGDALQGTLVDSHRHLSIIRCHQCGKEAPYLTSEIIPLNRTARAASAAA